MGMVPADLYPVAQAEANRLGIPLGGHLPTTTMAEDAAAAGIRFIAHLGPGLGVLASCAENEDEIRAGLAAVKSPSLPNVRLPFKERIFGAILKRIVVNPQLMTSPELAAVTARAVAAYSDEKAHRIAQVFVEHETWTAKRAAALPTAIRDALHALYDAQLRLTKVLADAGVPLLTGSDVTGASWEIPGASLHQEFDELAAAGLSPLQVLRATTSAPARFVGRTDFGSVAEGRRADLVLLRDDPTRSVGALHSIVGVLRIGAYRSEADVDALTAEIARDRSAG